MAYNNTASSIWNNIAVRSGQGFMWGLEKYGQAIDWTNDQVNLANVVPDVIEKPIRQHIPNAGKVMDFSYHDARSGAVKWISDKNQGVGIAANILLPDAIDFATGGLGYVDNLAKGARHLAKGSRRALQKGDEIIDAAEGVARGLGKDLDNALQPAMALALPGGGSLRQSGNIFENTMMAFGSKNFEAGKGVKRLVDSKGLTRVDKARIAFDAEHFGKSGAMANKRSAVIASGIDSYNKQGGIGITMRNWTGKKGVNRGQKIGLQGSTHHFGMDLDLVGHTMNTTDAHIVSKYLRDSLDVFPGDHRFNYIMAYHDNTKLLTDSATRQVMEWTGKPLEEVTAFMKRLPDGSELGRAQLKGKSDWKVMDMLESLKETKTRPWKSFLKGSGKKITDLDLPAPVMGVDHQDLIHGAINSLESRKALIEFANTDKWLKLSPKSRALRIAEVAEKQQNIALNVNKWRLDKMVNRMIADGADGVTKGKFTGDWTDIQAWMMKNPHLASSLDWHKTAQIGTGMTVKQLTKPLNPKDAKFVAQVFNLEKVPKTGSLIKKLKGAGSTIAGRGSRIKQSKDQALENVRKAIQSKHGKDAIVDTSKKLKIKNQRPKINRGSGVFKEIPRSGLHRQYGYF